ncbi:MAG TPA: NAD(P)/FAD-dependent oxidoreductase [Candidatus Udaeobacter sp.]|jgi:predicted flavoprotein YhiN|nr:NAD(P)/FAD-dependent oxidoreductase [Candidatus Udaeobacter sp.]
MSTPSAGGRARRVAVVGAGAAGLTAALRAAESGAQVALLNAHPRIGLKILMSGGTRCNVTHREVDARDYNGGSRPFVARILRAFTPAETIEWMQSLGVELKLEETGKYFPVTDDAETVLDGLLSAVGAAGVDVQYGARVVRLERGSSSWRLGIQRVADSAAFGAGVSAVGETRWPLPQVEVAEWIEADAVILASGGLSFPRTGSDGTGYALAMSLGHTLVPPVPALTPLASSDSLCREAQGITLDAELTLWVDGRRDLSTRGSLLIAHFGFSGPVALDLSRHWLRADGKERRVRASFVPSMNAESFEALWLETGKTDPRLSVRRFLGRHVPDRVAVALLNEAGIDPAQSISQLRREHRARAISEITARDLGISGTLGYEKAEATAGGITLSEVDPSTLESRKAPGVFLCGEMLDVDGRLGGFNFQWAWSSGTVAGRSAGAVVS